MIVIYLLLLEFFCRAFISKNLFFTIPFLLVYFLNKNRYFIPIFLVFSFLNDLILILPLGLTGLVLGFSLLIVYLLSNFVNLNKFIGTIISLILILSIFIPLIFYLKLNSYYLNFILYVFIINFLYSIFVIIIYKLL
jgi:hypothetical protein